MSPETAKRLQQAAIRFIWTWVFAFVSQPVVLGLVAAVEDGSWTWTVNWNQVGIAALAAVIYALKRYTWPDTKW